MYGQNPALKLLVVLGVFLGAYYFYGKPGNYAPPDDPWFRTAVLERPGPILVKFGRTWCGPCRMTDAELAQLPSDKVVKIDVGEHPRSLDTTACRQSRGCCCSRTVKSSATV